MDLVYLWCDINNSSWRARLQSFRTDANITDSPWEPARYDSNDELRFSLRSIELFAPFVRNIFVVTDQQQPSWLIKNQRLTIVDLREIIPAAHLYPVFNSVAIESYLNNIPKLSDRFLYSNDDMFFLGEMKEEDFIDSQGILKIRYNPAYARKPKSHGQFNLWRFNIYMTAMLIKDDYAAYLMKKSLKEHFKVFFRKDIPVYLPSHQIEILSKELLEATHKHFSNEVALIRNARFRKKGLADLRLLWQFMALKTGLGVLTRDYGAIYLSSSDIRSRSRVERRLFVKRRENDKFLCLNSDRLETTWNSWLKETLQKLFPKPSQWEK